MHPALADAIVKVCRQRETEGDCPTVDRPGGETMEFCILELASQRDAAKQDALRTLGEAVMKFAPYLVKELAARWAKAKADEGENLERFLAVLRQEH